MATVWNEEIDMKHVLSLFALSLIATGLIGLLTLALTAAAPTLEIRVLAVIGAAGGLCAGAATAQPGRSSTGMKMGKSTWLPGLTGFRPHDAR